jgi:hypothetical protein
MNLTPNVRFITRNQRRWLAPGLAAALCALFSTTPNTPAADAPAPQGAAPESGSPLTPAASWKPAWLAEAGVTVKESFDDNVLMSDVSLRGGTATLNDKSSAVTTVSPKLGFDFARSLDASGNLGLLSLAYAPDFAMYHSLPSEDYDAHRLILAVRGKAGAFSYNLENTLLYVDASRVAPAYPSNQFNAWATINAFQRREQLNDRSKLALQYDRDPWFIRPTASLAYYGMMTEIKNPGLAATPSGYQDYCTRYDVNGGADVGRKFGPDMAATLGYRHGSQGQEKYSFEAHNSSSDYQRVLVGVEGRPCQWLNLQLQGGPDFRSYEAIAPLSRNNFHPVTFYGEAALSAAMTPEDTLSFKYKQFEFVSCLGVKPYFDSSYGLSYDRKFSDRLGLDLGARLVKADYTAGSLASCARDDLDYVLSADARWAFTANVAADLGYAANLGRSAQDDTENRDFDSQEVSLGVQLKF